MKYKWLYLIALLSVVPVTAKEEKNVLTEETIRQLIEQKDKLIREHRPEDVAKLYATDAVFASELAALPGSYQESAPQAFLTGIAGKENGALTYATTPLSIEIAEDGQTAVVENEVHLSMHTDGKRARTMNWQVEELLELSLVDHAPKIAFDDFYIARQSLEPDELSKRIMALVRQDGEIDKQVALELLEESQCRYHEGKQGGISIGTSFGAFACGDEIPALASRIPNVQELVIFGGATITDAGLQYLGKMKHLQNLMLMSTEISNAGIASIAACESLESLMLDAPRLTDASLEHIASLPNLQSLNFNGGEITGDGIAHLAKSTTLSELSLGSDLTNDDLAGLSGIPNLTKLTIAGETLSDAGLEPLAKMEKLESVDIHAPDVTYAAVKKLKERKPGLRVGPASLAEPCKYSLERIEKAKVQWADANKKEDGTAVTANDLAPLLEPYGGYGAMKCEEGGHISINAVGEPASCSIHGKTQALKRKQQTAGLSKDDFDTTGAKPGRWTMDVEAAKKLAAEKQLPLLMNFSGSDWCGWCKLMERNVFAKADWKTYAAGHIVMVLIDFPRNKTTVPEKYRARNEQMKQAYGITGFPTFVLLNPDGETELGRLKAGRSKTPESFIEEIKAGLQSQKEHE